MKTECVELYKTLETLQRALDLGAQESIAGSTFHLSRLSYWQYLAASCTAIFIMLIVGASYALLYEVNQATRLIKNTLQTSKDSSETELQPYLSIVDISVQTGEPPFGGGDGWIDITFKNFGKTPARNFRNHHVEKTPDPLSSQYVEMLDGAPVVHTIKNPGEQTHATGSTETILLDFINIGEERTVRCPIVTDIVDRSVKQRYMETEWERRNESVNLPKFEGYRIRGSIDFSNFVHGTTTRRLRFELTDSIDNGKSYKITEDKKIEH